MAIDTTLEDHWAELRLSAATTWGAVRAQLETIAATGDARVVLLMVENGSTLEEWEEDATLWLSREYTTPVVITFAGPVSGPMAQLALAADIRIAADSLVLDLSGISDTQSAARIATLFGSQAAADANLRLTAAEALDLGLVSRLVPTSELTAAARGLAQTIAARGPIATKLGKEAVWRGLDMPLEQALRFETDLTLLLQTTKDRAEGVAAFAQKRNPHFTGE